MRAVFNPLFLHFFDIHYLEQKGLSESDPLIQQEASLAVRFALLASDEVLVPAASYFESLLCRSIVDQHHEVFSAGHIWLVGSEDRIESFVSSRLAMYREGSVQHNAYLRGLAHETRLPPWRSRTRSATEDLKQYWRRISALSDFPRRVLGSDFDPDQAFEDRWLSVPDRLAGEAFIVPHVAPLALPGASPLAVARLHGVINPGYFGSYTSEFEAGVVTELVYLNAPFALLGHGVGVADKPLLRGLQRRGVLAKVAEAKTADLLTLRDDDAVAFSLLESLASVDSTGPSITVIGGLPAQSELDLLLSRVLAIPAGRPTAEAYHLAVAALLERLLVGSLREPIIESPVDGGFGRIDITFANYAPTGFFQWARLNPKTSAPYGIFECKNYTGEVGNTEVNQLLSRMSPVRGNLGFLVYREAADEGRLFERCTRLAMTGSYVMPLSDGDLEAMVECGPDPAGELSMWLRKRFRDACGGA